jgi:hypothetical protein
LVEDKEEMTNLVVDLNHETESVPLKFIFVVERLNDFERTRSVIITHHGEFVSTKSAALNDLLVFGDYVIKKKVPT